jgi:hypothetical protein
MEFAFFRGPMKEPTSRNGRREARVFEFMAMERLRVGFACLFEDGGVKSASLLYIPIGSQ